MAFVCNMLSIFKTTLCTRLFIKPLWLKSTSVTAYSDLNVAYTKAGVFFATFLVLAVVRDYSSVGFNDYNPPTVPPRRKVIIDH